MNKTKLKSAITIAAAGKNVTIVKCNTESAQKALQGSIDITDDDGGPLSSTYTVLTASTTVFANT